MIHQKRRQGDCKFIAVVGNLRSPKIYIAIMKFCESVNPVNPGNGIFKLAMLNREM